jgi:hypothetical protein
MLRALEVFYAECVYGHDLDSGLVADFEDLGSVSRVYGQSEVDLPYPCQRFKSQIVPFYGLNVVIPRKPPVSVHDKRNMLWNWALLERSNEELS